MRIEYTDGGRIEAGFRGKTGDCVTRALAIVLNKSYKEIYDLINDYGAQERITRRRTKRSGARTGVYKNTIHKICESFGLEWTPCMKIGSGCKVHLRENELPKGRLIVSLSKHCAAVIDGVLYDTHDCSRNGTRCVYGYWRVTNEAEKNQNDQI